MASGASPQVFPDQTDFALVHDTAIRVVHDFITMDLIVITPIDVGPPEPPPVEVPAQILGGKGPLLRPDYDMLAEMRADATGEAMRIIRSIQRSVEETARQERELEEATC